MTKKLTFTIAFLLFVVLQTSFAANINITISGFAYSPNATSANIGDVVTIQASSMHPLVQVDQTTWLANGNTPMGSGWGTKTAAYTFTITTASAIYYVCANHVSTNQMKGLIGVANGIMSTTAGSYNIDLYPNPVSNGEFTVKFDGNTKDAKVLLYDEQGKLVETHLLTGITTNIKTKLSAGSYFYTIMVGTEPVFRNKFMVTQSK